MAPLRSRRTSTRPLVDAFWAAGYTSEDVATLGELWHTDPFETKAKAGQLLLDGQPLPLD